MEFCGSRNLASLISSGSLSNEETKGIFGQIVRGVSFLHSHSVFHRDLKLENILFTSHCVVKIVDLGLAVEEDLPISLVSGTPAYFTPDQLKNVPYLPSKVDIWCLGIVLYCLLCGKHPFGSKNL